MSLWAFSNSCSLNLLLVRSHQAEIIIAKRLIQGRKNVTRVRVNPLSPNFHSKKKVVFLLFILAVKCLKKQPKSDFIKPRIKSYLEC